MIFILLYGILFLAKLAGASLYVRRFPAASPLHDSTPVTVCQAILSGDPDLESALSDSVSALSQARFVWVIDQSDQEARRVTSMLVARYPNRAVQILSLAEPDDGINPKLFKLEAARQHVVPGIMVVLDDDTRLSSGSCRVLVQSLERSELATGLPFYREASGTFGNLLAQFVNNNAALTYLAPLAISAPLSINGMCYALRTETLERMRGFAPLLHNLTDDLAVADRIRAMGGRIVQTPYPQEVATTVYSARRYFEQMHRWYVFALLLLRRRGIALNLMIVLLYALPPFLLWVGVVDILRHVSILGLALLAGTLLVRSISLALLQKALTGTSRHRPAISIASELLQPVHLAHALLVRSIRWRSRHYRVIDNDRFESL